MGNGKCETSNVKQEMERRRMNACALASLYGQQHNTKCKCGKWEMGNGKGAHAINVLFVMFIYSVFITSPLSGSM